MWINSNEYEVFEVSMFRDSESVDPLRISPALSNILLIIRILFSKSRAVAHPTTLATWYRHLTLHNAVQ